MTVGILGDAQRRKQNGAIHAAIFGLAQSIERLHRGLYVRVARAVAAVEEIDVVAAVAAGGAVDLDVAASDFRSAGRLVRYVYSKRL